MVLARNSAYHGRFWGNVQRVELSTLRDRSAKMEMYETDHLDILDFNILLQQDRDPVRRRHARDYVSSPILSTGYIAFDASQPPFDDPRVRRAFVLATDRETLADEVMKGLFFPPTGGFVPLGMPGHSPGISLPYDPEGARHLLAEAGYPNGGCGFPAVEALLPTQAGATIDYLAAQWRENLGIEIEQQTIETGRLLDRLSVEPSPIFGLAWSADYPDPDAVLRVGVADIRGMNRWRNEAYDRLIEEARRGIDQRQRMKLYAQADQILVEEAAIVPVHYRRGHLLVKPWVRNYLMAATEKVFWRDVIIEPH